jgi:hypothetical protein
MGMVVVVVSMLSVLIEISQTLPIGKQLTCRVRYRIRGVRPYMLVKLIPLLYIVG